MGYLNANVPELRGYESGTVLGNLDILDKRVDRALESTVAALWELSEAICRDAAGDADTLDSILLSLQTDDGAEDGDDTVSDTDHLADVNRPTVRAMMQNMALHQRILLYRFIGERLGSVQDSKVNTPNVPPAARGRIAYMPSAVADEAYLQFSNYVSGCRAATFDGFADACEEVYGGLCEYCILPIENTVNGKLTGFYRLIAKYRLQAVAVCSIENRAHGNEATRFALLHHRTDSRTYPTPITDAPDYLETLHLSGKDGSFADVMAAASFCGLLPVRVDTLPLMEELLTDDMPICAVWDVRRADLTTFLRYMMLEVPDDRVIGLYPDLHERKHIHYGTHHL